VTLVTFTAVIFREPCNKSRACVDDQSVGNTLQTLLITVCHTLDKHKYKQQTHAFIRYTKSVNC